MNTTERHPDELARMKTVIDQTIDRNTRRRTRRHRLAALGAAGVIVLGTSAGALAIAAAPQGQVNYTADCYAAADLTAQHGTSVYLPGDEDSANPVPVAKRVALATDMCAQTWKIGTFSAASSGVPDLVACQLPDQRLGIFPSSKPADELCSTLGLGTPHD